MTSHQEQMDALSARFIELQKELCRVRLNACRAELRNPQINHVVRKEAESRIQAAARSLNTGSPCVSLIVQIEHLLDLDE